MNTELLRSSDKGVIKFRFMYHPEYIKKDSTILLREGRTKILGVVTRIFNMSDDEEKENRSEEISENTQ